jgi:predicted ATPase
MDLLPTFVEDGIRFEDLEYSKIFGPKVADVYRQRNIPVVPVPLMSVEERVQFILSEIAKYCSGVT